ncbi:MAG: DegT/DnrJ/EryC1/StrS family aminotransferase [Bacteroidota bacterium]
MSVLAIKGGKPVREKPISPWPLFDDTEKKYLLDVLESRKWGKISGKMNEEFEKRFSEFQNAKHTITVCNGTVALRIALFAAGISPGDEVIVPSYTFVASATSVIEANAIPVFADIEEDSFNISPDCIEKLITEKTKAIMPVHFGGASADMDRIMIIANKYNLKVIEDAAQAQGSKWNNNYVGSIGNVGTFSFQLSKNMTAGEGGAVVTNDDLIAERVRSFHNCGRKTGYPWYFHFDMGGNFRLTEFQAAILLAQLEREESNLTTRSRNAKYLTKLLSEIDGIEPIVYSDKIKSSYYLFVVKYNSEVFNNLPKEKFVKALNAEGITTLEGYPFPLYRQPLFKEKNFWAKEIDYNKVYHPISEKACQTGFWFPNLVLHGNKEDTESIVEAIHKIKNNVSELLRDDVK